MAAEAPLPIQTGERWPLSETAVGLVVRSGLPICAADMANDARFVDPVDLRWVEQGFRSLIIVPLCLVSGIVGTITVFSRCLAAYDDDEVALLQQAARQIAAPIDALYRHTCSRRLAVAEERNRIARQMYDGLVQSLTGALLQLDAAERQSLAAAPVQLELQQIRATLRRALAEARGSLWNLQPSALEDQSLPDVLRAEIDHWGKLSGVPVRLFVRGEALLALPLEAALLRIVQEALHNTAAHADAREVRVELEYTANEVRLQVSDDGRGFVVPPVIEANAQTGLGVMASRARGAGGECSVSSWPNNGTRVEARFPRVATIAPAPAALRLSTGDTMRPVRLLLVEPQTLIRQALSELIGRINGVSIVAAVADGYAALDSVRRTQPDLVLMEMELPGMDGAATLQQLQAQQPDLTVVMLTSSDSSENLARAVQAGARGYILKDSSFEHLSAALHDVLRGEVAIERRLTRHLAERFAHLRSGRHAHDSLSDRELEVLRLMVAGQRNREIASSLLVSEHTVKTHISNIFQKLGVNDRAGAVTVALQRNIGGLAVSG
jgi:DNA-binding NarL/FixJ family response regulator/signal transduction histidine kinase